MDNIEFGARAIKGIVTVIKTDSEELTTDRYRVTEEIADLLKFAIRVGEQRARQAMRHAIGIYR